MTDDGAELFLTRDNVAETMPKIDALVCHDLPRLVVRPSNKVLCRLEFRLRRMSGRGADTP